MAWVVYGLKVPKVKKGQTKLYTSEAERIRAKQRRKWARMTGEQRSAYNARRRAEYQARRMRMLEDESEDAE